MQRIQFLRGLLGLPISAPTLLWLLTHAEDSLRGPFLVSVTALYFGWIPYFAFCASVMWLLRRQGPERFARFLVAAPIWFLLPVNLGVLFIELNSASETSLLPYLISSGAVLALGYTYVAVGSAAYWLAGRFGLFPSRCTNNPLKQTDL